MSWWTSSCGGTTAWCESPSSTFVNGIILDSLIFFSSQLQVMVLASSICSSENTYPWLPLHVSVDVGTGYSLHLVDSATRELYAQSGNFSMTGAEEVPELRVQFF